ncbi:MAG TPA: amidohydrolase [Xanthomonadales bacterium]|nr:amidohydrolase [Xanthomonadales bacterium]
MTLSRRRFVAALAATPLLGAAKATPDLILHHGHVITVDPANPRAEAIAIWGDRILHVGGNDEVLALAGPGTKKIDLGKATVVPGFIDAHSHPAYAGLRHLDAVDCDLRSIAEITAALRERAARTPKGEWVLGFKYDDTKTKEGRRITRADLDAALPDHPAIIQHRGGHTAYANSKAFARVGVSDDTPDPDGGRFGRDADGKLDGFIAETAQEPFASALDPPATPAKRREGVALMSKMMARAGITSVHDAYGTPDDLRAYQEARDAGELRTRTYCLVGSAAIDAMLAAGVRTGLGDDWVRVGAMKMTCDGSISERTARLSQPFVGTQDHGILIADAEALYPKARKAHDAGWQIGIHANGDVAIDMVLGLYERLQREAPRRDPRFRIEHCTVINDELVARMRALGVIPTPFSTYVYFHGEKMRHYGEARVEHMFALRSFLDAGVRATQASDYPPGPYEPMMALQSSVTRTAMGGKTWGASQRITAEEAIRVGTLHGAYASFEEDRKGSITAGKLADLTVLARDPLTEDPSTLITIPVQRTMAGGRWTHEA